LICVKAGRPGRDYRGDMSSLQPMATDSAAALDLTESAPAATGIVTRTLLQSPEARVTLFTFGAGQELTTHTNRRRVFLQVLSGAGDFFYNDAWHRHGPGAWLHFPPNHPHAVRAPEAFTMLLTVCAEPQAPVARP
jgi:quercetin dioxygenase-like cupin family protein